MKEVVLGRLAKSVPWEGQKTVPLRRFIQELYPPGTWEKVRAGEARVEVDGITLEEVASRIPTRAEVIVFAPVEERPPPPRAFPARAARLLRRFLPRGRRGP